MSLVEAARRVAAELGQPLSALEDELGGGDVIVGMLFERGRDDLDVERALQMGDRFGALVDQQHDHVRVGMVGFERAGDADQQRGVVGARRRQQ